MKGLLKEERRKGGGKNVEEEEVKRQFKGRKEERRGRDCGGRRSGRVVEGKRVGKEGERF